MFNRTPHAAAILTALVIASLSATMPRASTGVNENPARADETRAAGAGPAPSTPQPPASSWHSRPIFVCHESVTVIFSDRPCGTLAVARVLRVHDPGPGSASPVAHAPTPEATRPRPEPRIAQEKRVDTDERCRKLRDERERLDDRMRAGYPAREAAQLWNRWREVDAKIYAARC